MHHLWSLRMEITYTCYTISTLVQEKNKPRVFIPSGIDYFCLEKSNGQAVLNPVPIATATQPLYLLRCTSAMQLSQVIQVRKGESVCNFLLGVSVYIESSMETEPIERN